MRFGLFSWFNFCQYESIYRYVYFLLDMKNFAMGAMLFYFGFLWWLKVHVINKDMYQIWFCWSNTYEFCSFSVITEISARAIFWTRICIKTNSLRKWTGFIFIYGFTVWNAVHPWGNELFRPEFKNYLNCVFYLFPVMLFEFAIAFAIFALLKFFQGGVTRMLPPLLLAGMVHGPHLIGMVSSNEDKSVTGKILCYLL